MNKVIKMAQEKFPDIKDWANLITATIKETNEIEDLKKIEHSLEVQLKKGTFDKEVVNILLKMVVNKQIITLEKDPDSAIAAIATVKDIQDNEDNIVALKRIESYIIDNWAEINKTNDTLNLLLRMVLRRIINLTDNMGDLEGIKNKLGRMKNLTGKYDLTSVIQLSALVDEIYQKLKESDDEFMRNISSRIANLRFKLKPKNSTRKTKKSIRKSTRKVKKSVRKSTKSTKKSVRKSTRKVKKSVRKVKKSVKKSTKSTKKSVKKRTKSTKKSVKKSTKSTKKSVRKTKKSTKSTKKSVRKSTKKSVRKSTRKPKKSSTKVKKVVRRV